MASAVPAPVLVPAPTPAPPMRCISERTRAAKTLNGQATFVGKAANETDIRRFLVGPKDCEITGVDMTPDGKTMFVNIQHPGDGGSIAAPAGSWPNPNRDALAEGVSPQRPRSATICITRTDGGVIGL